MGRIKRLSALFIILAVIVAALVSTTGVVQAAWRWCDDPVLSIGNAKVGYTTVYVQFAIDEGAWDYAPTVNVEVPQGVSIGVLDPQGSTVITGTDDDLRIVGRGIQTNINVLILPKPGSTAVDEGIKVRIRVSLDPDGKKVLVQAVGRVGEELSILTIVPTSQNH